jgi:CelD/BcsL family acetyltransferase involved in cellulose biosynthesis
LSDPLLARSLACSMLYIGGAPAAFAFTLEAGPIFHCIANGYSERFAKRSPGRVLLYRVFASAADRGFRTICWGAGDAGYKSQMGAEPGPEILDHLFLRSRPLAALLKPIWSRRSA